MTFSLAVDPNLTEFTDLFNDTLRMQFHAFVKMFGDAPDSRYLVTIREAQADDGESFEDSFNQVIAPGRISERSIVWANTLGHELFHYWNGNHFLVGDSKETVEWFGEGFTEYYASLALLRTGVISEELWLRKLETYLARYFISTQMWPEEPPSLVAAGSEKHKNWLRIYGGGATVALVLDIEIRAVTQGSKGLDDVMLLLVDRFGLPGGCYTNQDILVAVNDVSGRDFTSFFDTHVFGLQASFDFQTILAKAGITSEQFADEFYLSRTPQASPLQIEIFDGITKPRYLETEQ